MLQYCPACGGPLLGSECTECEYSLNKCSYHEALVDTDGTVLVPTCTEEKGCMQKQGEDTTHFCKFLVHFQQVSPGKYMVNCDPIYRGRVTN